MQTYDLAAEGLRGLNSVLQSQQENTNQTAWQINNPRGSHAVAVGLNAPIDVTINGSTGYYCAGMNQQAKSSRQRISWSRCCRKYDVWFGDC